MSRTAKDQVRALKSVVKRHPLEVALGTAFVLLALYAGGYQVGKAKALADNRADQIASRP